MNDKLLKQIGNLFTSNTALLRKEIQEIKSELKEEIKESEEKLEEKIAKSQEETVSALTELMSNAYDVHEERIKKIEKELHISSSQ